jgi:hypothetical protein
MVVIEAETVSDSDWGGVVVPIASGLEGGVTGC